jgi:hypothetical protein
MEPRSPCTAGGASAGIAWIVQDSSEVVPVQRTHRHANGDITRNFLAVPANPSLCRVGRFRLSGAMPPHFGIADRRANALVALIRRSPKLGLGR